MIVFLPGAHPPGTTAETRRGQLDTGSEISIVTEAILEELGIPFYQFRSTAKAVNRAPIELVGFVPILWRQEGDSPEMAKDYITKFYVMSKKDSTDGADFDFLLGKDWNKESGALIRKAVRFMTLRK